MKSAWKQTKTEMLFWKIKILRGEFDNSTNTWMLIWKWYFWWES